VTPQTVQFSAVI